MSDWIPAAGQPIGYVEIDGKRHSVRADGVWYRAFNNAFNERLGGIGGKSVTQVDATAQGASGVVVANAAALESAIAALQANAASTAAAIASIQAGGLPGSGSIPPADPGITIPPVDPGDGIPGYQLIP
jgi:hypothetical protein